MRNVHLIPTDKPSRLYLGDNGNFVFGMMQTSIQSRNDDFTNQNISITNSEEIKEGDWCYDKVLNLIFQTDNHTDFKYVNQTDNVLKIILTDNPDLIADGVQSIDNEFLEWFVKKPSCEEVKVETFEVEDYVGFAGHTSYPTFHNKYKIIIPKEGTFINS